MPYFTHAMLSPSRHNDRIYCNRAWYCIYRLCGTPLRIYRGISHAEPTHDTVASMMSHYAHARISPPLYDKNRGQLLMLAIRHDVEAEPSNNTGAFRLFSTPMTRAGWGLVTWCRQILLVISPRRYAISHTGNKWYWFMPYHLILADAISRKTNSSLAAYQLQLRLISVLLTSNVDICFFALAITISTSSLGRISSSRQVPLSHASQFGLSEYFGSQASPFLAICLRRLRFQPGYYAFRFDDVSMSITKATFARSHVSPKYISRAKPRMYALSKYGEAAHIWYFRYLIWLNFADIGDGLQAFFREKLHFFALYQAMKSASQHYQQISSSRRHLVIFYLHNTISCNICQHDYSGTIEGRDDIDTIYLFRCIIYFPAHFDDAIHCQAYVMP